MLRWDDNEGLDPDLLQEPDDECPYCNGDGMVFDWLTHEERRCRCTINEERQ